MEKTKLPLSFFSGILSLLFCCSLATGSLAQKPSVPITPPSAAPSNAPPSVPYAQQAEFTLGPLDKSQIPTGILYDAVFTASDLDLYTGTDIQPATNHAHFFQAYYEMYQAAYQKSGMKTPEELANQIDNFHPDTEFHHPVGRSVLYEHCVLKINRPFSTASAAQFTPKFRDSKG